MAHKTLRLACTSSIGAALLAGSAVGVSAAASAAPAPHFTNCDQAKAAGYVNIHRGQPGYSAALDRNHNGVACEADTTTGGNTHATTPAPVKTTPTPTKPVPTKTTSVPTKPVPVKTTTAPAKPVVTPTKPAPSTSKATATATVKIITPGGTKTTSTSGVVPVTKPVPAGGVTATATVKIPSKGVTATATETVKPITPSRAGIGPKVQTDGASSNNSLETELAGAGALAAIAGAGVLVARRRSN